MLHYGTKNGDLIEESKEGRSSSLDVKIGLGWHIAQDLPIHRPLDGRVWWVSSLTRSHRHWRG